MLISRLGSVAKSGRKTTQVTHAAEVGGLVFGGTVETSIEATHAAQVGGLTFGATASPIIEVAMGGEVRGLTFAAEYDGRNLVQHGGVVDGLTFAASVDPVVDVSHAAQVGGLVFGASVDNATWTPAKITTAMWLDAADSATLYNATSGGSLVVDGGTVRRWGDKSGNSRHATNATGPTYSAANNRLEFNTSTYLICEPGWGIYWELIAVIKFNRTDILQVPFRERQPTVGTAIVGYPTSNNAFYRIREASSGLSTSLSAEFGTTPRIVGFSSRTTNRSVVYRDGTQRVDFSATGAVGHQLYLGVNGTSLGSGLSGSISEFIVLPTEADTTTRQKLEGYLAHKWGLTANLPADHPYKTIAP